MKLKIIVLLVLSNAVVFSLKAQKGDKINGGKTVNESPEPDFRSYMESIFSTDDEMISDDIYESFLQMYHHPVNLNLADHEDLASLRILSDQEISAILERRLIYGNFLSFQEIYLIEDIDSAKINLIRDFLIVETVPEIINDSLSLPRRVLKYGKSSIMLRYSRILEGKKGYINSKNPDEILKKRYYLGTPDQLYIRYSLEVPDYLKVGFTAEKDAGESLYFSPKQRSYGFDHYAGFIQKKYHFWLKDLTIGDFQVHSGQGLVMGNGLITGKGTEPIRTAAGHDRGLRPYQGSTEYNFFRGMAVQFGQHRWSGTAFFSYRGMDASVDKQDMIGQEVIRSILKTGYHRTPVEMEKKNAVHMSSAGIIYRYRSINRRLHLGISGIWNKLNLPVLEMARYYNQFDFSGRQQVITGLDYKYFGGKYSLFGECAYNPNGGFAFVQGIIANLSYMVETIFHIRHYGRQYYSFTGRSFGEYTVNTNEQGMYWGLRLRPGTRVQIHSFFDLFRSPWLRNGMASPGTGYEWMIYFKYSLGQSAYMDIFFREEHKGKNFPVVNEPEYSIGIGSSRKIRLSYQYGSDKGILVRSRLQGSHYSFVNNTSVGYAVIQDLGYRFSWGYVKGGVSYFQTGDYSTRQYTYEPDVLYYFSVPSYFGRGMRYFMLVKVKPTRRIDCWIKVGQYYFFEQDTVGNGLEEIPGNKKTEIRCQFRFKF